MRISSSFVFFSLLASLVSGVVAATPDTLFRGDSRGPKTIKDAGGFKAKGFDNPEGTLFEHVEGTLKHPSRDPFVSSSSDIDVSKKHAGTGYLYTLDSSKIGQKIWDVAEEYKKAGKKYGHADEKEFAVEHLIKWDAVTKIQKKKDGEWKTIKRPTEKPTKALSIMAQFVPGAPTLDWLFLETDYGRGVGCRTDFLLKPKTAPWEKTGLTYPGGTWPLSLDGSDCEYKNSGNNTGTLWCDEIKIGCVRDDPKEKDKEEYSCDGGYRRQAVFTCAY